MNNYCQLAFLLLFPSILFGQLTDEDTYWIAIESRQLKDEGIFPMDGTILHFSKDSLYMHHIFHDSIMVFYPTVTLKKIRLDGEKWGRIKYWKSDSLVIVFDRRMLVKFVPVSNGDCDKSELAFWEYGEYVGKDTLWEFNLKLYKDPWVLYPNDIAKECIVQGGDRRYKYSALEKWSVIDLEMNHIFSLTFGQFEPRIFKVTEYHNDTAKLELLGAEDVHGLFLAKKPRLSDKEFSAIMGDITEGRWRSKEVLDYATSFANDTIEDGLEFVGSMFTDTTLFKKSSLLENQLSLEFSANGTYTIFQADSPMLTGDWKLLPSGDEIVFGSYDFMDIFEINGDTLVIGKYDKFDISYEEGREEGDFMEYYYKLRLEK